MFIITVMSKTLTISNEVYEKLMEVSSREAIKRKKRTSINDILKRDYVENANSSTV